MIQVQSLTDQEGILGFVAQNNKSPEHSAWYAAAKHKTNKNYSSNKKNTIEIKGYSSASKNNTAR